VNVEAFVKRAEFHTHAVLASSTPLLLMCSDLCNDLQYDRALALATGETDWEDRWDTQLAVGIVHHRLRVYSEARAHYDRAAALAPTDRAATALANIGTTWFEEDDLEQARAFYAHALDLFPADSFGLLGLLAVACRQGGAAGIELAFARLTESCPDWRTDATIQHNLLHDNSFRPLRQLHPDLSSPL
jgi:tetratricopeptide (TPR) repeat protein